MINTAIVTTTATKIIAADPLGGRNELVVQNRSGVSVFLAKGDDNGALLDTTNGLQLDDGDILSVSGTTANLSIWAIHGSSGNKTVRYQTN